MKLKRHIKSQWMKDVETEMNLALIERVHQKRKWGEQNHKFAKWHLILSEEVGEMAQAMLNAERSAQWGPVHKEAIQVAAVALSIAQFCNTGKA